MPHPATDLPSSAAPAAYRRRERKRLPYPSPELIPFCRAVHRIESAVAIRWPLSHADLRRLAPFFPRLEGSIMKGDRV